MFSCRTTFYLHSITSANPDQMILKSTKSVKLTLIANSPIAQHALLATEMVSFSLEVFCCKSISRVNDRESRSWKHVKKENSIPYQLLSSSIKKFNQPRSQMNRTNLNANKQKYVSNEKKHCIPKPFRFPNRYHNTDPIRTGINETHT